MNRISQEAYISGRVQGVAYRAYCMHCAAEMGIGGFARNLPDGSVHVLACGLSPKLKAFWTLLKEGPPMARVDTMFVSDCPSTTFFEHFEIRY